MYTIQNLYYAVVIIAIFNNIHGFSLLQYQTFNNSASALCEVLNHLEPLDQPLEHASFGILQLHGNLKGGGYENYLEHTKLYYPRTKGQGNLKGCGWKMIWNMILNLPSYSYSVHVVLMSALVPRGKIIQS